MPYALCFLLFMIGLYCAVVKKNMVKIVLGILIMEYAVNLFLVMLGYRAGGQAPVVERGHIESATGQISAAFVNSAYRYCNQSGVPGVDDFDMCQDL